MQAARCRTGHDTAQAPMEGKGEEKGEASVAMCLVLKEHKGKVEACR